MEYLISKTLAEYEKKHWTMLQAKHSQLIILMSVDVFNKLSQGVFIEPSQFDDFSFSYASPCPYIMFYQGHQVFIDKGLKGEKWGFAVRIDGLIFHKEYYTNDLLS